MKNIDLSHLEDKYFTENIYEDIEEYECRCHCNIYDYKHNLSPIQRMMPTFKDLYGYEIIFDCNTGLLGVSEDCDYLKPIDVEIELTYIDPTPIKTIIDQIKKEQEIILNDALNYVDVYHYTFNPNYGRVVHSGFGGSAWYEFEDGTVKTYLDLLCEGVKF